jgi:hypothetical protein
MSAAARACVCILQRQLPPPRPDLPQSINHAARRVGRPVVCSCSLPAGSEMLQVGGVCEVWRGVGQHQRMSCRGAAAFGGETRVH